MSIWRLDKLHGIGTASFKIGDKVKYKYFNIEGRITSYDIGSDCWVINNTLIAPASELELISSSTAIFEYADQNGKIKSDKTPCNCDWNEVLRYGCKNPNHR